MPDLSHLLRPKTIAVIGGGAWCESVILRCREMGFGGAVWPVHPSKTILADLPVFASLGNLPGVPDAVFIGVNRFATVELVAELAQMGAGGAVCFASGFKEAESELSDGASLQDQLLEAAGEMPILGPNCYGVINALDGALLWPDQHGCTRVERGVAILTQSSNISINLTMQARGLPIAYMVACGNMAQLSQAEIAMGLLDDPRVTAIGLHIEGFTDLSGWEALAKKAWEKRVPLVAIKVGASEQAQAATISHTASLAGSDAGASALLQRLGIPRLKALPEFLECLKLLHCGGPLTSKTIASISCSGGEASLVADMALDHDLSFPALSEDQKAQLRAVLGPKVALSNPLDYHTYIWRDATAMGRAWAAVAGPQIALTFSVVDYPRTDASDWEHATAAAIEAHRQTGARFAVVASLPELMPEATAQKLMAGGVIPFAGLTEALAATEAAGEVKEPHGMPLALPGPDRKGQVVAEAEAKAALADHGVPVPQGRVAASDQAPCAADGMTGPFAVKAVGLAHKSDQGGVRLNVPADGLAEAAHRIGTPQVLIEEMVSDAVAELLIGVVHDPAHGFVLTLGAGGVMTELLRDSVSLLLPVASEDIRAALTRLRCSPLLTGFRGKPAADLDAIIQSVLAVQSYVLSNRDTICEVEINPLLCTPAKAVAADALIRKG